MGQVLGVTEVVSSATALVLTNESPKKLYITGTVAQVIRLPAIANLEVGVEYVIINRSSAAVSVTDAAGANAMSIPAASTGRVFLINKTSNAATGLWVLA